jgi:hypothetical protein
MSLFGTGTHQLPGGDSWRVRHQVNDRLDDGSLREGLQDAECTALRWRSPIGPELEQLCLGRLLHEVGASTLDTRTPPHPFYALMSLADPPLNS